MACIEACVSCSPGNGLGFAWDVLNCQILHPLEQMRAGAKGAAYADRHHTVVSMDPDKVQCTVHYLKKKDPRFRCSMPEKMLCVDVASDGVHLLGGGVSGKLYLWRVATGTLLRIWDGHYKAVSAVSFTPDGGHVVSGSEDATIKSWSLAHVMDVTLPASAEIRPHHTCSLHTLGVTALALGSTAGWVASAGRDRTVRVHDFVLNQDLRCFILPSLPKCLAVAPQMAALYAGCADGKIYETSLNPAAVKATANKTVPQAKLQVALLGHEAANGLPVTSESSLGSYHTGVFEGHAGGTNSVAVTMDGLSLVSGGQDGQVHVWQVSSKQLLRSFNHHKSPVSAVRLALVPSRMPNEKESQLTYPFNALKKNAITGDGPDDYTSVSYHCSLSAGGGGGAGAGDKASMFEENNFGKAGYTGGGRRAAKRRRLEAAKAKSAQEDADAAAAAAAAAAPAAAAPAAPAAPTPAPQEKPIVGTEKGESVHLLARLYTIAAEQQKTIERLQAERGVS